MKFHYLTDKIGITGSTEGQIQEQLDMHLNRAIELGYELISLQQIKLESKLIGPSNFHFQGIYLIVWRKDMS